MNKAQATALREVAKAIILTVKEVGNMGAPGGIMYAALMAQGCTLDQFEQIMGGLTRAGYLDKRGDCYHFVKDL